MRNSYEAGARLLVFGGTSSMKPLRTQRRLHMRPDSAMKSIAHGARVVQEVQAHCSALHSRQSAD
jgi:hypothetical protein